MHNIRRSGGWQFIHLALNSLVAEFGGFWGGRDLDWLIACCCICEWKMVTIAPNKERCFKAWVFLDWVGLGRIQIQDGWIFFENEQFFLIRGKHKIWKKRNLSQFRIRFKNCIYCRNFRLPKKSSKSEFRPSLAPILIKVRVPIVNVVYGRAYLSSVIFVWRWPNISGGEIGWGGENKPVGIPGIGTALNN